MTTVRTDSVLDAIVARKKVDLENGVVQRSIAEVRSAAELATPARELAATPSVSGVRLVAEIKRQSPSRGVIRERFDPVTIAQTYQECAAAALSILTDTRYFGGQLSFLRDVKAFTELPILRKDFIIDEYQIYESAQAAADAILLIARLLPAETLKRFVALAGKLQLDVLAEVHNETELDAVLHAGCRIIGINHRDLDTLQMDPTLSQRLVPRVPKTYTVVAESGLHTRADVERMRALGVDAVLIGEAFMESPDIAATVRELMG